MIKHIVFFKLKDSSLENIADTAKLMRSLDGKVPQLSSLEIGEDFGRSERSYDLSLLSVFSSREDLEGYRAHPYHQEVVEELKARSAAIVAVDYESDA